MNSTEPTAARAASRVAGGRIGEEGGEDRQRLLLPALQAQPSCATSRASSRSPRSERGQQPAQPVLVLAEAGDLEPGLRVRGLDQRPCGQQQVDALGDDQLADEDDETGSREPGRNSSTSTPGGPSRVLALEVRQVGERRPEGLGRVAGADEDAGRGFHALAGVGKEASGAV